jgi:lysophospholipase L1-like esterase
MELKGKKINFLGDSITKGVGTSCGECRFVDIIAREEGLAAARNYGISGTTISYGGAETGKPDTSFCARVPEMDPDADIVVVFGGTNDFGHSETVPLGTPQDRTRATFRGACHELMRSLIERYPRAAIVILTPMHRKHERTPNTRGAILEEYVDILRETARYYALPVLDLYAAGGIQPAVEKSRETYMPDRLHPNDAGNRLIADRLTAFLRAL